ncbi:YceI family protein [Mucilaginibacter sp. NFR10]|uniref:YceI family protein n=1 Tax=Mucilaginibacter sp. NFR10 TaxID=1566292 RepID=UPI000871B0EC|nr:YceI family protein [Mucilaginibacter sp. NFR10]SCW70463.1 Polyisoprenoid-binding protein YceI [Mucilaginibacter sp. NFR10]
MLRKHAIILLLSMALLPASAQQTYHLDIKKSKVLWDTRKTMGGHYGYLLFKSGSLEYTAGGEPKNGTFSLNMNTMHSTDHADAAGNKKVDEELKKEGFFAVDRYPEATMVVKEITRVGQSINFKVTGILTIKGISNPIEFMATIIKKNDIISAKTNTTIDRIKWKIDMQPRREAWDFFSALKNTVVTDEIAVSLNLIFTAD